MIIRHKKQKVRFSPVHEAVMQVHNVLFYRMFFMCVRICMYSSGSL